MSKTPTKPALVYIRAAKEDSRQMQRWLIKHQASGSEFHITDTVVDTTTGTSGLSRPGLEQLFDTLRSQPHVHDIIVYSADRLARRVSEERKIMARLAGMGVTVHYAEQGFGAKSFEATLATIIREQERATRSMRAKLAKKLPAKA